MAGASDPAILADAFEALIGALYLDGGWEAAASVVRSCLEPRLRNDDDAAARRQDARCRNGRRAAASACPTIA